MFRRLLMAGGGASFSPPPAAPPPALPTAYTMLYNGQTGDGLVRVGRATSTDAGLTWTRYPSNPVIGLGSAGTWNDAQVHAPCVLWDGSQWVLYASGYDGTNYRIGRWTSADRIAWTQYGSNPLLGLGSAGSFDDAGVIAPQVTYNAVLSPAWKMWYVGSKSGGKTTIGFADSTDGLNWTKRGKVIDVGAAGDFDDEGVGLGCAVLVGATWYVFVAGQSTPTGSYRAGYVTCTDPATAGTYTKHGVLAQFAGTMTLDDGYTYISNTLTSVFLRGSTYVGYGTTFDPDSTTDQREVAFRSTSADLVTWTTPTGVLLPLASGTFDTISAENPSVVET